MGGADIRHVIAVCTRCPGRHPSEARPGLRLQSGLRAMLARDPLGFEVTGAGCMAGCGHPLTVAFTAPGKASYLFGDIDADTDAEHLAAFAHLYGGLPDGWCSEGQRPARLAGKTLARIPAAPGGGRVRCGP